MELQEPEEIQEPESTAKVDSYPGNPAGEDAAIRAMNALVDAFHRKQIWPDRRKITIRQWNGNPPTLSSSVEGLQKLGFEREMQDMVLWRKRR